MVYLLIFSSCSSVKIPKLFGKKKKTHLSHYSKMTSENYSHHISSFETAFYNTPGNSKLSLGYATKKYVKRIVKNILSNNETFFTSQKEFQVHIIKDKRPIHFSLAGGKIFVSSGLITKYIKHEAMIASVISFEMIRSEKNLYPRQVIIPTGYMKIEKLLSLLRIPSRQRIEIHKWAYYIIKRSGYSGEYYLSWLQVMNRNTADFLLLAGDIDSLGREEAMFKSFLIGINAELAPPKRQRSSRDFYRFIGFIRRRAS